MASVVERKLQHRFAGLGTDAQIVRPYRSRGRVRQYQSLHVMICSFSDLFDAVTRVVGAGVNTSRYTS